MYERFKLLLLAIKNQSIFEEPIGQLMIEDEKLKLIVFDPNQEAIVKWIL
ncbi:hypothetical protein QUB70_15760 [Microcoleus sp. A003_D6]